MSDDHVVKNLELEKLSGANQVAGDTDAGTRSLRHSWAIRALAHDTPIKAIADVLGHRYIDTTFIYAKADLNSLREVAMPWPQKGEPMATCLFRSPLAFRLQAFLESRRSRGAARCRQRKDAPLPGPFSDR